MTCMRRLTLSTLGLCIALAAAPLQAGGLRSDPAARPAPLAGLVASALSALDGLWAEVATLVTDEPTTPGSGGSGVSGSTDLGGPTGDNGAGIDPNG